MLWDWCLGFSEHTGAQQPWLGGSRGRTEGEPEAEIVVVAARREVESVGAAAKRGDVGVAAPSADAVGARSRPLRIGHLAHGVTSIPIRTQLPKVAVHVLQPPVIWPFRSDLVGFVS